MKAHSSLTSPLSRRTLLKQSTLAVVGAGLLNAVRAGEAASSPTKPGSGSLREKFYGCIAACYAGSSMGAAVEGWDYEKIEAQYGTLEKLLPYEHYGNGWKREPGTTEDG